MKILLVEDDDRIADALAEALTDHYYTVDIAADGEAGRAFTELYPYDLVILDLMLPKLDGISLCQQLRTQGYPTPILMLTARDSSSDKVVGLDAGADDYVVKPFDLPEIMARIRALMRRQGATLPSVLEWEKLRLNPNTYKVTYNGVTLNLTPKEYGILDLLLRHSQRVFSRGEILDQLWSYEDTPGEEMVKVHIRGLRQKLKQAGAMIDLIETVYGLGYRLNQRL
jgi:DNA-binding response OmpR family regulator